MATNYQKGRAMTNGTQANKAAESLAHHFELVIDNDEKLYRARRSMTAQAIWDRLKADEDGKLIDRHDDAQRWAAATDLGDALKDWAETMLGVEDDENLLRLEMLTTALDWIDWRAMGRRYVDEELDEL